MASKIVLALIALAIIVASGFMLHRRTAQSALSEAVHSYMKVSRAGPFEVEQKGRNCGSLTDMCLEWKIRLEQPLPLNANLKLADDADREDFISGLKRSGLIVKEDRDLDLYKDEYRSSESNFCSSTCDVYLLTHKNITTIYLAIYEY